MKSDTRRAFVGARGLFAVLACGSLIAACSTDAPTGPQAVNPPPVPPPPVASIVVAGGNGQTAETGSGVPATPQVRLETASGAGVSGVRVQFAVTAGGGSIQNPTVTTDASGVASPGTWTLGVAGPQTLRATADGVGSVDFTATATGSDGGTYAIEIRYNAGSSPTSAQATAFSQAKLRWESIIIGDLPNTVVNRAAGTCTSPNALNETVDDLVIFVTLEAIDGPGGVLGSAGPCVIRSGSLLPVVGQMRLDIADLANMGANGSLNKVIAHEMGHVLGVGSLWSALGVMVDPMPTPAPPPPVPDPHFTGSLAIAAFNSVGGSSHSGAKVPIENTGSSGTINSHWRETVFSKELMTGWINSGTNPLSLVTVQSLADMGYGVSTGAAQSYSLPVSALIVPAPARQGLSLQMKDDVWVVPVEIVEPNGAHAGLIVH